MHLSGDPMTRPRTHKDSGGHLDGAEGAASQRRMPPRILSPNVWTLERLDA
jgi:hypothetical protein